MNCACVFWTGTLRSSSPWTTVTEPWENWEIFSTFRETVSFFKLRRRAGEEGGWVCIPCWVLARCTARVSAVCRIKVKHAQTTLYAKKNDIVFRPWSRLVLYIGLSHDETTSICWWIWWFQKKTSSNRFPREKKTRSSTPRRVSHRHDCLVSRDPYMKPEWIVYF